MNGKDNAEPTEEESTDTEHEMRVAKAAEERREQQGYTLDNAAEWANPKAHFTAGRRPAESVASIGDGTAAGWSVDDDQLTKRTVEVGYSRKGVRMSVSGDGDDIRTGMLVALSPSTACELGTVLFGAGEKGRDAETPSWDGTLATLTPGSLDLSGEDSIMSWLVERDDAGDAEQLRVAHPGGGPIQLDVETRRDDANASLLAEIGDAEAADVGAMLYQAGEDAAALADLDDADGPGSSTGKKLATDGGAGE